MYGGHFETLFPGINTRLLGASPVFATPGSREISLWMGAVDASPTTARGVLDAGLSMAVYPGGSREIFNTDHRSKNTILELKNRSGFVRLAVQYGVPLVPVAVFGERDAYRRVDLPAWLQNFCLRRLRVPLLLFFGRWGSWLPPKGAKIGVVFGAPLPVPHVPDAGKDHPAVLAAHAAYIAAYTALWNNHKSDFGYADDDLLVIS